VSIDPVAGQMTGPNGNANRGRLSAFQNMLASARASLEDGDTETGCSKLASVRDKVTGPHAWFAGEAAAALLAAVDELASTHGCAIP
jgi:hypothetical protein